MTEEEFKTIYWEAHAHLSKICAQNKMNFECINENLAINAFSRCENPILMSGLREKYGRMFGILNICRLTYLMEAIHIEEVFYIDYAVPLPMFFAIFELKNPFNKKQNFIEWLMQNQKAFIYDLV